MTPDNDVAVLMYHSVADSATPEFTDFVVAPQTFADQMAALADAGCTTATMSDLAQARAEERGLPAGTVVLTFDDGFLDFAHTALPVLQSHGFTATLYVTTRYVGGRSLWLRPEGEADRPMIGWADLAAVVDAGVEIGAHTHTHPQLDLVHPVVLARELTVPKVTLEDRLGVAVTSVAYPFGYASRRVRSMTAQLGYTNACIVSDLASRAGDDPYAVPRLTVTGAHTGSQVAAMSTATSGWPQRRKADLRRGASRTLRTAGLKKPESASYSRALR